MLIDINECLKPALSIIDACMCMEETAPHQESPDIWGRF